MKKNYIILSAGILAGAIVLMSSSSGRNDDRTGAPSSNGNCSNCHSGGTQGTTINIGVTEKGTVVPVSSYQAGKTYTVAIVITASGLSPAKGFQSTILDATNSKTGTTANTTGGSRIISANNRDIAVQSSASLTGIWSYEWTAPANPTGTVTVYAAGIAANGNFGDNGDMGATTSKALTLDASTGVRSNMASKFQVYPNPCGDKLQISGNVSSISVIDLAGREQEVALTNQVIDTKNLMPGFYFLKWHDGQTSGTVKFQKI